MDGYIDSYLQAIVNISNEELELLEKRGQIIGSIIKTPISTPYEYRILKINLCNSNFPNERELRDFDEEKEYEVYVGLSKISELKVGRAVGGVFPRKWMRSICIKLEEVF